MRTEPLSLLEPFKKCTGALEALLLSLCGVREPRPSPASILASTSSVLLEWDHSEAFDRTNLVEGLRHAGVGSENLLAARVYVEKRKIDVRPTYGSSCPGRCRSTMADPQSRATRYSGSMAPRNMTRRARKVVTDLMFRDNRKFSVLVKRIWLSGYNQDHTIRVLAYNQNGISATWTSRPLPWPLQHSLMIEAVLMVPLVVLGLLVATEICGTHVFDGSRWWTLMLCITVIAFVLWAQE